MPAWRRVGKWKLLLGLAMVWLAAVVVTARPGDRSLYPGGDDGVTVYLVSNGFHTDIAIPADAVRARGGLLGQTVTADHWAIYGWGDSSFFTGKGMSLARAADGLRALFRPGNPSVIRVFGVNGTPDQVFSDARPIRLSRRGFEAMARRIEASLTVVKDAPVLDPISTAQDNYFASTEHFSILRLCNNWTADQLAAAGLPTAPMIDGLAPLLSLNLSLRAGVRKL